MTTLEKLEKSKVKLTIEIPAETFDEATQRAYRKDAKHYRIDGFRQGKAPRHLIEQKYGEGVFFETAFELLYPDAYTAAVQEHELSPVGRPDVEILEVGKGKTLVFSAVVDVVPEVVLGQYKGIKAQVEEYTVTDQMVDAQVQQDREKLVRYVEVDRPAELGDRVILDYAGSVDGVAFDGGTAQDQVLELGSGRFIPGFEEQVAGLSAGGAKDISVTFPENYHAEQLKGKPAAFAVQVKAVQVKEYPELDDEFAKDVSEFDTFADYQKSKRDALQQNADRSNRRVRENEVAKLAGENAKIDIPDAMVDREIAYMIQDMGYRLRGQGLSLEDYLKFTGQDMAQLQAQYRPDAAQRVRTQLTLQQIAKEENIVASDEEIAAAVADYAKQTGQEQEAVLEKLTDEDRAYFAEQVVMERTLSLLVENATFVPKEKEADKAPAKKKAAAKAKPAAQGAEAEKPAAKKPTTKAKPAAEGVEAEKPAAKKEAAKKPAKKKEPQE